MIAARSREELLQRMHALEVRVRTAEETNELEEIYVELWSRVRSEEE